MLFFMVVRDFSQQGFEGFKRGGRSSVMTVIIAGFVTSHSFSIVGCETVFRKVCMFFDDVKFDVFLTFWSTRGNSLSPQTCNDLP